MPDIDLTPHNAYETGVSRLHGSLNISKRPITIQDLGSVNGTRVNGKKLAPHSKTSLSNGDILTLGKLKVTSIHSGMNSVLYSHIVPHYYRR